MVIKCQTLCVDEAVLTLPILGVGIKHGAKDKGEANPLEHVVEEKVVEADVESCKNKQSLNT